jgi:uncharacterized membrane protein AbrB (regulator of aidB expression)
MLYAILGLVSLGLAVIVSSPYWLRTLNNWTFKTKNKRFFSLIKFLRKLHRPLGLLLAVIAIVHGYVALNGQIRLHTGLLVYIGFLLTAVLGGIHYKLKNKTVFKFHKAMALVSFLLLAVHLIFPWALGQLFGIY